MVTRAETKMVTGKINGIDVTVPAGTSILEAARLANIEVPNLCYQPKLRAWGSCRICTVEILGKRGGLIESCATPLGEGMEVLTHSEPVEDARQFVLQMYLVDHALDCPTCDKSGECYLQDNTYLSNVNANPYRRPKFAKPYVHFSDLIDFKHDRCIMCTRCTRVCDEMIGVTAIEATHRSIEATIAPAFGETLADTLCTNCGMCIAVCPVGALTDRHFAHHPWELDTTESICGMCDVGCTLNVETNKGVVRRVTNLWERGVNQGYLCYHGKWGHEAVQSPDRIRYPKINTERNFAYEVTWDDAIQTIANTFRNYQGSGFAALISPDGTNEEAYIAQKFVRMAMHSNSIDRNLSASQYAVEAAARSTMNQDVSSTNSMQELQSDVRSALVVGPNIGEHAPIASYWLYHSRIYRDSKTVVISQDEFPLCWRAEVWLKPRPGTTAALVNGMAKLILDHGWTGDGGDIAGLSGWRDSVSGTTLGALAELTGCSADDIHEACVIYATGGAGLDGQVDGVFPPSVIYQTAAHIDETDQSGDDPLEVAAACNHLAAVTGNVGRAGGGVLAPRGPANYQGATDMGAVPYALPGGSSYRDGSERAGLESTWGVSLPTEPGFPGSQLATAIRNGQIKAMYIEGNVGPHSASISDDLLDALANLDFLVVAEAFDTPLAQVAHVVLPRALTLETDGTLTSFDRTVQRVRATVPVAGESRSPIEVLPAIASAMGVPMKTAGSASVMAEISRVIPDYAGVNYARLERGGLTVPVASFADAGTEILSPNGSNGRGFSLSMIASAAD